MESVKRRWHCSAAPDLKIIIFGQRQTICQNDAETHTGHDASSRTSAIITLHHTLSHWWLGRVRAMTGLGRAGQRWLSSAGSELSSGRVRLLSAASRLSFCRLFSDVSLHQWLMSTLRTRLIFHLQPASQLFAEPQCRARMCERAAPNDMVRAPPRLMWFSEESKGCLITWLRLSMNHLSQLSLLLCLFVALP